MAWVNKSDEFYIKEMGEEEFLKRQKTQFQSPSQWFPLADLVATTGMLRVLMAGITMAKKSRVPHVGGVGLKGTATVLDVPDLPDGSFFSPGRTFSVNARLSSSSSDDDTLKDTKGCGLKFYDDDTGSNVMDVIMQTGDITSVFDLNAFMGFVKAKLNDDAFKKWVFEKPTTYKALSASYRRCPESYSDQRFHVQMTYIYESRDGLKKLARLRLIPADGRPETGLLSEEDQRIIWERERRATETRNPSYLRDEILNRVKSETIEFNLQIQIHDMDAKSGDELYNNAIKWNDVTSPWQNLMAISLVAPLTADETRRLTILPTNLPPCLSFQEATSRYSPGSIPYVRDKAYRTCQAIRRFMDY